MIDSEDLYFSPEALAARYTLLHGNRNIKQNLNNINLFVEDVGKEYQYESIFKRLFKGAYPIVGIFPVGGKRELKKRFNEFGLIDDKNPQVKNIYIADGDFDRYAHSEEMISNPQFIYLKTYNIENYFIDEGACIQFVKGKIKCLDNEVKKTLDFNSWKTKIVNQSQKLFLVYCFLSKYYPDTENVSRPVHLFLDMDTGFEREDGAFDIYVKEITEKTGDVRINERIDIIKEEYISINGEDFYDFICGKFLIDSLFIYISKKINKNFRKEDFIWHLINNFDISKLDYVKDIILSVTKIK